MKIPSLKIISILFILISITVSSNSVAQERASVILRSFELKYDTAFKVTRSYDVPECFVSSSPQSIEIIGFQLGEKIISYAVSPVGDCVGVIVEKGGSRRLKIFDTLSKKQLYDYLLPSKENVRNLCWHPKANALFVVGGSDEDFTVFRLTKNMNTWDMTPIYMSTHEISNLIVAPLPFVTGWDNESKTSYYAYRVLFAEANEDGLTSRIVSITESGSKDYQVIGPKETMTETEYEDGKPSYSTANHALPLSFHPSGESLIFRNQNLGISILGYFNSWGGDRPQSSYPSADAIEYMPNGLGFLTWRKDKKGVGYFNTITQKEIPLHGGQKFIQSPKVLPDGKSIIGLTLNSDKELLSIFPIVTPLPDVQNAYLFTNSEREMKMYSENHGLFRPNSAEQLYQIYETENYYNSSNGNATRPYIVTTDIFWELFASAYQGLFILKEREDAIPLFWRFSEQADSYLMKNHPDSKWNGVFKALIDFRNDYTLNPEVGKMKGEIKTTSSVSNIEFSFHELKPRGHYTTSPELAQYFKGFKYFTTIFANDPKKLNELSKILPPEIQSNIVQWIASYNGFISSSRAELIWKGIDNPIPDYCTDPAEKKYIFPLSWGFDNEVLNRTVQHKLYPKELQLNDSIDGRWLPSGLDLAAVMGSNLADNLLASDYRDFPNLKKVIESLKSEFNTHNISFSKDKNLYNLWLSALSTQWTDTLKSINNNSDSAIWKAKRLQTGLASWTTLRHTTVLVNERTGAEAGEGGYYEELLLKMPRGTVEADPETFKAISNLFELAERYISSRTLSLKDIDSYEVKAQKSLYDGMMLRIVEAKNSTREFSQMAQKVRSGELLNVEELGKIRNIAGTAEHLFLIFKSLANKQYALSTPDPMAKVVDVAGGGNNGILSVAVGNAMQWDYITPFYGRKQVVKGATYSFYEIIGNEILNDEEWREKVKTEAFPTWITPFIYNKED